MTISAIHSQPYSYLSVLQGTAAGTPAPVQPLKIPAPSQTHTNTAGITLSPEIQALLDQFSLNSDTGSAISTLLGTGGSAGNSSALAQLLGGKSSGNGGLLSNLLGQVDSRALKSDALRSSANLILTQYASKAYSAAYAGTAQKANAQLLASLGTKI